MIDFSNLKIGDKVFIVPVSMRIGEHVYAGVFNSFNEWDTKPKHVFLNSFLNNLETVSIGYEKKSNEANRIFYTEAEAKIRLKQLWKEDQEKEYEY